jgi:hypothetical protein
MYANMSVCYAEISKFANHPTPDVEAHEGNFDGVPCSGSISIGPYTVVIFSQDQ